MDRSVHKPINRIVLACIQCRARHVRCDGVQPVCTRCKSDGKECTYQKSKRGGLDKAALARRRERLQNQEVECTHKDSGISLCRAPESSSSHITHTLNPVTSDVAELATSPTNLMDTDLASSQVAFQVSTERLLSIYYESCWPACPVPLPLHHLNERRLNEDHEMDTLLLVLQYIGSIFAPWTFPASHYELARIALSSPLLPRTPWNCQALMLFATAQLHTSQSHNARGTLYKATSIAIEIGMNTQEFAITYGQGDPVLEESWRRTYHFLTLTDQHFAVIVHNPVYALISVPNLVDLPCDDEFYESGIIPTPATWQQYDMREFDDTEVVFSSIAYLSDVSRITSYIMKSFVETRTFNTAFVATIDAKLAAWHSLLPAIKRDPMRQDGSVDEVMFLAHMMAAILMMSSHRPFSSLAYSYAELTTTTFAPAVPFMNAPKQRRPAHTARTLKACDIQTKLLAIPCAVERHNILTGCIVASIATAQIAACSLLEDHALSIARDRVRLSIGYLKAMGTYWSSADMMTKEVRFVARSSLNGLSSTIENHSDPAAEIEVPRDDLAWPIDPSIQADIFAGMNIPTGFGIHMMGHDASASSSSSGL